MFITTFLFYRTFVGNYVIGPNLGNTCFQVPRIPQYFLAHGEYNCHNKKLCGFTIFFPYFLFKIIEKGPIDYKKKHKEVRLSFKIKSRISGFDSSAE